MERLISAFFIYITIFLFGMTIMKLGFRAVGDEQIKSFIQKTTNSPVKGVLIGTALTAALQSSSAVTVITVGLAASGLIRFANTIGIVVGANIGTTFTSVLASFSIGKFYFLFLLVGLILLFSKNVKRFCTGTVLIGLGCLFLAMNGFHKLSLPLRELAPVQSLLTGANHSLWIALLIGAIFTALIQSSSATTLIAMGFLSHGLLTMLAAVTIIIGANIGTCITALLASIGANWQGRWVSYTHLIFNVGGAIVLIPFLKVLTSGLERLPLAPDANLALASILFNLLSALIFLPFINRFGNWIEKKHNHSRS